MLSVSLPIGDPRWYLRQLLVQMWLRPGQTWLGENGEAYDTSGYCTFSARLSYLCPSPGTMWKIALLNWPMLNWRVPVRCGKLRCYLWRVPARSDALRVLVRLPLVDARVVHERRRHKPSRLAEVPASSRRLIPSYDYDSGATSQY